MNVTIKSTKLELTPAIRNYIEAKMEMLEKYLGNVPVRNCDFEIEKTVGNQHKGEIFRAELNLNLPHELLIVDKTEDDLYKAIDKVKSHMELMIKKYKDKIRQ